MATQTTDAQTKGATLALEGGAPVREDTLPYGGQTINEQDIEAVTEVLRSEWLTTGPKVKAFEDAFASFVGAKEAVAVSNGTAALHAAMHVLGIGKGDEVVVTPLTFAATANSVCYQGGTPVFADVEPDTLLADPGAVEAAITERTKAIAVVDYGGQPCDYDALREVADRHGVALLDDACHAIGGSYKGAKVGTLADLNTFSLHPVKNMTTGEGGVITTDNVEWARSMRVFRNHGITSDHRDRAEEGSWFYEMVELGYNYRLTDFQCALGISQLERLPKWTRRRQEIAAQYDEGFSALDVVTPLTVRPDIEHAYHLYVIQLELEQLRVDRGTVFEALQAEGIGVNVHYVPVHMHPYYQEKLGTQAGLCPVAEAAYERILTLPVFPQMTDADSRDVVQAVTKVINAYRR